jgi:hypothetical protein
MLKSDAKWFGVGLKTAQELWQYGVPFRSNSRLTLCICVINRQSLPHLLRPWRDWGTSLFWPRHPEEFDCVVRGNVELPRDAAEPRKLKSPP